MNKPEDPEEYRNACERCVEFNRWLWWAQSEPSSLRQFLSDLWDEHVDAEGEAAWSGE